MLFWILVGFAVVMTFVFCVAMFLDGGGSWIKEDGTIIEWDGKGFAQIVEPDGTAHILRDGKWFDT